MSFTGKTTAGSFHWLIAAAIALSGPLAWGEPLFEGAPPVPPGYDDYRDAQQALQSGEVPRFQEPDSVPEGIAFHDDLVFAKPEDTPLTLDLYVPQNTATPPPLLLFIHGGGWRGGHKESYRHYSIAFAREGYAAASVQYRLAPEHTFPKAIHDVKCALAWLRENAERLGFDGTRVVLLGGSAGGHLALLAGYSQDPDLECPNGAGSPDTRVQGIVNIYGVVDCTTPVAQQAYQVNDFIGASYEEAAHMYALASPISHLDADDPPTLTFHGTIDELVPVSQADTLHAKLDELGVPNYYDRIEGWPHSMDVAAPINERCRYIIARFLERYLPLEAETDGE